MIALLRRLLGRLLGRLVCRPGPLLALLAAVAVLASSRSLGGAAAGLLGAVTGALAGLAALQLGMLAGALAFGARVHKVVIGIGRRWKEWVSPRCTVALRGVPVLLSVAVGPGRPPLRLRMWAAAACSAAFGLALTIVLWLVAVLTAAGTWRSAATGAAIGAAASVLHALLPRQDAASTSTGWLLVGLPRMPPDQQADLAAGALADEAACAVNAGELDRADAAVAALAQRFPAARATAATRVTVLEARGRYAEALSTVLELAADPALTERDAAFMLAGVAGLAATGVESGQVPADAALPIARQAVQDAVRLGYPSFKLDGTRAVLALVDGDAEAAARLARAAAGVGDHALSRADDLATLARALMACGDNRAARAVLAEAEALAPWWPRVAATRARLSV